MDVSSQRHAAHAVPLQIIYRHHNLFHYFPLFTQAIEAMLVLEGAKPAAQQLIHDDDLSRVQGLCKNLGLGVASAEAGAGWHLVMLAEAQEPADQALFHAHIGNHARLGEVLGYPPCCVGNYLQHIRDVSSEEAYALLSPAADIPVPFGMNYLRRPHDLALLSHVPCSFRCSPSMRQAERAHATLAKYNPQLASHLRQELQGPVVVHGSAAHPLRGYAVSGKDVRYAHALATRESPLHGVFSRCDRLEVLGLDHVRLCQGDHVVDELQGDVRFLLFE